MIRVRKLPLLVAAGLAMLLFGPTVRVHAEEGRASEQRWRTTLRRALAHALPEQAAKVARQYGMTLHTPTGSERVRDQRMPERVIVLLHGLDDGGGQWGHLIPHLRQQRVTSVEVNYPNDQPIVESGRTLAEHLSTLRSLGAMRVDLVTHSMGALVAREVLTHASFYSGDARGDHRLPRVTRLVMVAPPNQGSECARFDAVSEWGEQTMRWFDDRAVNWGCVFDGLGEARLDLLPSSAFLARLNARPAPKHIAMTIVAGRVCGRTEKTINRVSKWVGRLLPKHREAIDIATLEARDMTEDVGDGVVSLKSAQLKGVDDFVIVDATHVNILTNARCERDSRVPPAVPIVLQRLGLHHQIRHVRGE